MGNTVIKRGEKFLRSYEVNGKLIEEIYIYKDGEILLHVRRSWLENVRENYENLYCGDLIEITISGEVKRANKLNLNRKDNFLHKTKKDYYLHSGYSLYIYADNFLESWEELPKKYQGDTYLYGYKVKLKYPAKTNEMYMKYYSKGEEIEECDKGKPFHNPPLRGEDGKLIKDRDGYVLVDENKYCCSRSRIIAITNCNFCNGRYISDGK